MKTTTKTKVELTWDDFQFALDLARRRYEHNFKNRVKDSVGGSNILTHTKGILGDIVVGKALNLPINTKVTSKDGHSNRALIGPDVGKFEVRTTTYKLGKWPIYKWDYDKSPYIFVVLEKNLSATIVGWLTGKEAKKCGWFGQIRKDKSPAFWISKYQKELHPLKALPTS